MLQSRLYQKCNSSEAVIHPTSWMYHMTIETCSTSVKHKSTAGLGHPRIQPMRAKHTHARICRQRPANIRLNVVRTTTSALGLAWSRFDHLTKHLKSCSDKSSERRQKGHTWETTVLYHCEKTGRLDDLSRKTQTRFPQLRYYNCLGQIQQK